MSVSATPSALRDEALALPAETSSSRAGAKA